MKYLILLGVLVLIGCSTECGGSPAPAPLPQPTPVVIVPPPPPPETFGSGRYGARPMRRFAEPAPEYEYRLVQKVRPAAPRATSPCQPCPDDVTPGPAPAPGPDPFGLPVPPPPPTSRPEVR